VQINSDADLADLIVRLIDERFSKLFWPNYERHFDREEFTVLGSTGWNAKEETPAREVAREPINKKKNEEVRNLLNSPFATNTTNQVVKLIQRRITGVKRQLVRRAVKNHIRFRVVELIFEDS